MNTSISQDIKFEDACAGILSVGSSADLGESLDFDFDFLVQTAPAPASFAFEQPQKTAAMQPHIVSMHSMSSVRNPTPKEDKSSTPYASLQLLAKNKDQQGLKRPSEDRPVASIIYNSPAMIEDDYKPPSLLSLYLRSNNETQPTPKRRKVVDPSLLHRACCSHNKLSLERVQGILRKDPEAASRQHTLHTEAKVYNYLAHHLETKTVRESYTYPLNLALQKQVNVTVVKSLIDADKTVLSKKDGLEQEGSLHVALKHQKANISTVDAILLADPSSAQVTDRHFNTPMHIACRSGVSMDVIRHLWILYPEAITRRNFHGLTPLDLARCNMHLCSDDVSTFLWNKVQETDHMA
jgi:hypothetical protein